VSAGARLPRPRRALAAWLAAWGLVCTAAAPVHAWTSYVDGISDQRLPDWGASFATGRFAGLLRSSWVGSPPSHIQLARYVVQWNVLAGDGDLDGFEKWLVDVREMGLTPEIAPTNYDRSLANPGSAQYRAEVGRLLAWADAIVHIAYLEPWNEPNAQGGFPRLAQAIAPAHYADEAHAICERDGCEVIAGNFEDNRQIAAYLRAYEQGLSFTPAAWGVHPNRAIFPVKTGAGEAYSWSNLESFERALTESGGSSAELWYTEVGAYFCRYGEPRSAALQADDASELVRLIAAKRPAHVFYYGIRFGLSPRGQPAESPCGANPAQADTDLYTASEQPRPAAGILLAGAAPGDSLAFAVALAGPWAA